MIWRVKSHLNSKNLVAEKPIESQEKRSEELRAKRTLIGDVVD
jgi:hypothetical protein